MSTRIQDRRRDPRVTVWSPLTLQTEDGTVEATLRNLSLAGVCCTSRLEFPEMTEVKVSFDLALDPEKPEERTQLSVKGAVVRCQPLRRGTARRRFELAIYFPDLDTRTQQALTEFISARGDDVE